MNKEIKKLLVFFAKAVVVIVMVDFGVGAFLEHFYDKMNVGEKARANYVIKRDTSDVVIFGSSRALYHYHPGVIGDSLNLSVYNAGRSNQTILYHLAVLKTILKRHVPRVVILDINEDEFVKSHKKYELLSALLPYCSYDKDIAAIYTDANPGYEFWRWSKTLPYNSSVFAILYRGLTKGKDNDNHGYLIKAGESRDSIKTENNCDTQYPIDPVLVESYHEFISLCKSHGIKVYTVVSPLHVRYLCEQPALAAIVDAAAMAGTSLYNFADTEDRKTHFADQVHLNAKGSMEFSKKIAHLIKKTGY